MRLNATELKLLSEVDDYQATRKRLARSNVITLGAFIAACWYFRQFTEFSLGILLTLLVTAFMHALRVHFEIGRDFKFIEILRKYVNNDADVIKQFATRNEPTSNEKAV